MPSFLIETYLAPGAAGERAVREQSASSAAEELTREGRVFASKDPLTFPRTRCAVSSGKE